MVLVERHTMERFDITKDYAMGARILLRFRWNERMTGILKAGTNKKKLKECYDALPAPEHHKDERNNFLYLMALGYPDIYRAMTKREIKKCTAMWGIEYLFNNYDEVPDEFTMDTICYPEEAEEEEAEEEEEEPKPKAKAKPVEGKRRLKAKPEPKHEEPIEVKAIEATTSLKDIEIVKVKVKKLMIDGKEYFMDIDTQEVYSKESDGKPGIKLGMYDTESKTLIEEPIDEEMVHFEFAESWRGVSDDEILEERERLGLPVEEEMTRDEMVRTLWDKQEDKRAWWGQ